DVGAHGLGRPEVVVVWPGLLREDGDVVPLAAPLARELACVDVRARPREEVAVPDEDPHGTTKPVRSIISGTVTNSKPSCSSHCSRISCVAWTEWLRSQPIAPVH